MSIARHSLYNVGGAIVPLLVSLVTVPLYLNAIGLDRYGVLSIAWLFLGYFNLFDLGLGRATAHRISNLSALSDSDRSRAFWSALLLSLLLVIVAVVIFVPVGRYGLELLRFGSTDLRLEAVRALPWLTICLPFGIINSVLVGALEGRQRFLKLNVIVSLGTVLTAIAPLATALLVSPALPGLIAAAVGARVLTNLLLLLACVRAVPARLPVALDRKNCAALLHFGKWATVTNMIGPILSVWDRYAIGVFISSAAVALYVVPFNLVSQLVVVPWALMRAAFPRLVSTDTADISRLAHESWLVLTILMTPLTLLMLVLIGPFLHFWIGADTATRSAPVAYVLLLGFWANSFAQLPFTILQARNQPRIPALTHLAELVPYLIILYVALQAFGIVGAAVAWTVRSVADGLLLFRFGGLPKALLAHLVIPASLLVAALVVALQLPMFSPARWLAHGTIIIAALLVLFLRHSKASLELLKRIGSLVDREG